MKWKILVVWNDGSTEYVQRGTTGDAVFKSRKVADEQAELFRGGVEGEARSVNVVKAKERE